MSSKYDPNRNTIISWIHPTLLLCIGIVIFIFYILTSNLPIRIAQVIIFFFFANQIKKNKNTIFFDDNNNRSILSLVDTKWQSAC